MRFKLDEDLPRAARARLVAHRWDVEVVHDEGLGSYISDMTDQILTFAEAESCLATAHSAILGLGVRRLALFGSVSRGTAQEDSDVDVLVEFQPGQKSYDRFLALGDLLEGIFAHPVELVTPESLSPFLRAHILAEAQDVIRAA